MTYTTTRTIANPTNLKKKNVWLFSGTKDTEVKQGVVDKLDSYYKYFGANVEYVNNIPAEHTFPTDLVRNTNACDY